MPVTYGWDLLVPTHRFIFAVEDGRVLDLGLPADLPADRFARYQASKARYPVHGMVTWPNTVLLRGPQTVLVDPGLDVQGPPLLLALERLGLGAGDVDLIVNTHHHADHTQANSYFPDRPVAVHRLECERYGREWLGADPPPLRLLDGGEGEVVPGLRFLLTPGHTEGSVSLIVESEEGRLILAGDTVGPLPQYFEQMDLPAGFPGRDDLLRSWRRIRELAPALLVPGHNPPVTLALSE